MLPPSTTVTFTHHVQQGLQQFSKKVFAKTNNKKMLNTVLLYDFKDFKEIADFTREF